ncbi:hypothetical protein [Nostoc sp. ATCC 53789]|uniref:hypothetical protein n=1 Tax=Nostoc sp. ATCC 53789 TaxID=76335 RepID=UPI000E076FEC|nr:hypothetical protein [Nostoc sp. ATCC 53789]QHG20210.1 hypothetical protein GJB62_30095 [Nostoc sp. ATCC 53789]RCJ28687.1 hypothetical protein A6V25_16210 [Nostoc sp. ATCC 53789]
MKNFGSIFYKINFLALTQFPHPTSEEAMSAATSKTNAQSPSARRCACGRNPSFSREQHSVCNICTRKASAFVPKAQSAATAPEEPAETDACTLFSASVSWVEVFQHFRSWGEQRQVLTFTILGRIQGD